MSIEGAAGSRLSGIGAHRERTKHALAAAYGDNNAPHHFDATLVGQEQNSVDHDGKRSTLRPIKPSLNMRTKSGQRKHEGRLGQTNDGDLITRDKRLFKTKRRVRDVREAYIRVCWIKRHPALSPALITRAEQFTTR